MRVTMTDADGGQHIIEADVVLIETEHGIEARAEYNYLTQTQKYIFREEPQWQEQK